MCQELPSSATARQRWLLVSVPAVLLPQGLSAIVFLLAQRFRADDSDRHVRRCKVNRLS
jgi:hypothetical protein